MHDSLPAHLSENPASSVDGHANPWDVFLQARVAAIGWLHLQARLNDGEIAKALSMTATEVFLVRARQSSGAGDPDSAQTQAAPLGNP